MDTLEVLRDAREFVSDPRDWTQEELGEIDSGPNCGLGAVRRAVGETFGQSRLAREVGGLLARVVDQPEDATFKMKFAIFNDSHTHAEVLAAFDRAIAIEEAKQAEFTVPENETARELVAA